MGISMGAERSKARHDHRALLVLSILLGLAFALRQLMMLFFLSVLPQ